MLKFVFDFGMKTKKQDYEKAIPNKTQVKPKLHAVCCCVNKENKLKYIYSFNLNIEV